MSLMFSGATSLVDLNLSGWDTSNVTRMVGMFENAGSLMNLDLSGWNTSNVTDMDGMFAGASSLAQLMLGPNTWLAAVAELPDAPTRGGYTGKWENTSGTWEGTAAELLTLSRAEDGSGAGTYVWQRTEVIPLAPTQKGAIVTIPESTGVIYTEGRRMFTRAPGDILEGSVRLTEGQTLVVVASATEGFRIDSGVTTEWAFTYSGAPVTPEPGDSGAGSGSLPATGSNTLPTMLWAVLALAAGGVLLKIRRIV